MISREKPMIRLTCTAVALLGALASAAAQTAPTSAGPAPAAAIEELVLANRILNDRGVLDAYGHVSIRHPANPSRYLMARAIAPGLVTAEDILEFDLDSNPVDRRGRSLFVERFIHGEVYKARPDVNSVIHTHSAGVIPFSVTQTPLRSTTPRSCMSACRSGRSARPAALPTCWCATASLVRLWPRRWAASRWR
jgi:hypothetical protein